MLVAGYTKDKTIFTDSALAPDKIPFAARLNYTTFKYEWIKGYQYNTNVGESLDDLRTFYSIATIIKSFPIDNMAWMIIPSQANRKTWYMNILVMVISLTTGAVESC